MRTYRLGAVGLFCMATWLGCSGMIGLDEHFSEQDETEHEGGNGGMGGGGGLGAAGGSGGMGGIAMLCVPGSVESCYDGLAGTEGLGACHAGVRVCNAEGAGFGECTNQVTPNAEDCGTPVDDDCNGVVNDVAPIPVLATPGVGETVAGGSITLEWTGGSAPYQVELAFDAAFTDPVTSIPPIVVWDKLVTVDGLNGGYFYWRVRSLGGCGPSEFTEGRELHVTCKPIQLTNTPTLREGDESLAWNAKDREYGIVFTREPDWELYFVRVNRMGQIIFGPTKLVGSSLPPVQVGYQEPDLAYISSTDRWAVVYHREGADQAYVSLFDDVGNVLKTNELDDGADSEGQSIAYHQGADRIITTNDHASGAWNTYVHIFDHDLNLVSSTINATMGNGSSGISGSLIAMDGVPGNEGNSALFAFYRDEWDPAVLDEVMVQIVDIGVNTVRWPVGSSFPNIAGKAAAVDVGLRSFLHSTWSAEHALVGIAYNSHVTGVWQSPRNVFFMLFDPTTGSSLAAPVHLNAATPSSAVWFGPQIAWDGEEFVVAWVDLRDPSRMSDIRITKLDATGQVTGKGDYLYPHDAYRLAMDYNTGRSLLGHDRIHVLTYDRRALEAGKEDVWLCIEPPYN